VRPHYRFATLVIRALARLLTGWRVSGLEHLPRSGAYIVAGNHISMLDPPLLGSALPVEAAFLAKVELFENPLFGALLRSLNAIPVRRGEADREAIERALAVLRGGRALVMFPEGTRDKQARLREPKAGLGLFAVQTGLPVIPAYIVGTNRFRAALVRRPRISITFGPPIEPPAAPAAGDAAARRAAYDAIARAWRDALLALEATQRLTVVR
jgi:1-acyl-sn-glycerol-3-phosphate acyltransferase